MSADASNSSVVVFAVLIYWGCSLTTVFLNKNYMTTHATKLDSPIFITWYQSLIATVVCWVAGIFSKKFTKLPVVRFDYEEFKNVFPLSITFVVMTTLTNFTLELLTVSSLLIVKSTAPIFVMIYSLYIFKKWSTKTSVLCAVVILIGFGMGMDQTYSRIINSSEFNSTALSFSLLSASTIGLYLTVYKRFLPTIDNCVYKLTFYNNLMTSLVLFIVMIFNGDFLVINEEIGYKSLRFWYIVALPGLFSYFSNVKQLFEDTSKSASFISFFAKLLVQTVFATYYYNEVHTLLWWVGNAIIASGLFLNFFFDEDNEETDINANEKYKLLEEEFNAV